MGQSGDELRILVGLEPADVVMQVGHGRQAEPAGAGQRMEDKQERDRIGPPRDGGNDGRVGHPQLVLPGEGVHAAREIHGDATGREAALVPEGGLEPPT